MQHRGYTRPCCRRFAATLAGSFAVLAAGALLAAAAGPAAVQSPPRAGTPVRGLVLRQLKPAPAAANALRFSVYGDQSGTLLHVRLLLLGKNAAAVDAGNYYQAPAIRIDFAGWKTFTVPFTEMRFFAEHAPGASGASAGAFDRASADYVQFALTATSARVFFDDLAWARTPDEGTSGAEGQTILVIDDFDAAPLAARAVGTYDQTRAVTVALTRTAPYVRTGTGALQVVVRSRAARERQLYAPTLLARLKVAKNGYPYVLYARPPFEPIVPESAPAPAEVSAIPGAPPQIRIFACADEIEPTTFAVFAGQDLKNATVTVATDFVADGSGSRFSRAALDVHVVKVWEQAGLDPFVTPGETPVRLPELLVKDDRVPLAGPLPPIRLAGDATTDIPAGTSKQFWVTVRVPRAQRPGTYRARLLFSAPGVKPTAVPIVVDVLPIRLRSAFLQYGIDLRARVGGGDDPQTAALPGDVSRVSAEQYARLLANIRDHGFRWVSLYDAPGDLADPLRLYKQAGLSPTGPVVVMSGIQDRGDAEAVERAKQSAGLPSLQTYVGTPSLSQEIAAAQLTAAAQVSSFLKAAPVVGAGILSDPLAPLVDVPVYSIGADYPQRLLQTGKRESNKRDWWTWNLGQENAPLNRLYAGFLLYRTGLSSAPLFGAFAGPFQYTPPGVDPFNETVLLTRVTTSADGSPGDLQLGAATAEPAAAATPPAAADGGGVALRPLMVTYPVQNGLLNTLQWEAAREGIDDIRYITTLKDYSRQIQDLRVAKTQTDEAEAFLKQAVGARPLTRLQPGEVQAIRKGIADRATKLLIALRAASKNNTID